MKKIVIILLFALSCVGLGSCVKDLIPGSKEPAPKGTVTISVEKAKYSHVTGITDITCTVSAKNVTADEVVELGFNYSEDPFSNYNNGSKRLLGRGVLSKTGTATILGYKKQYYVRGYLKTESGMVYSMYKTVTINK